jgi:hypothetical protein
LLYSPSFGSIGITVALLYKVISEDFISNLVTAAHRKEIYNYLCAELQMNIQQTNKQTQGL